MTVQSVFQPGDIVKVTGTSKGKGFAGGVKTVPFPWGSQDSWSIRQTPCARFNRSRNHTGRVYKGKKMAGHMGVETVTITQFSRC